MLLATPSSARVRLSVRYCRNLASASRLRSASTALSLAWPALIAASRFPACSYLAFRGALVCPAPTSVIAGACRCLDDGVKRSRL